MAKGIGRESDKFMLRLPDGMRDRIKELAESNSRSMNAEVVDILEHAIRAQEAGKAVMERYRRHQPDRARRIDEYAEFISNYDADKKVKIRTLGDVDMLTEHIAQRLRKALYDDVLTLASNRVDPRANLLDGETDD